MFSQQLTHLQVPIDTCSFNLSTIINCPQTVPLSFVDSVFILDKIHDPIDCGLTSAPKACKKDKDRMSSRLSGGVFRPRGALARSLYEKHQNDCQLRQLDKADWYRCDMTSLSEEVKSSFQQLSPDAETREFIRNSIEKASWLWTQIWHCLAKSFLSFFMTRTDINGWLARGSMFVLSLEQITQLLRDSTFGRERPASLGSLLDLGAGDGEVTRGWRPLFSRLYATEMSNSMRKLLESKDFKILEIDEWWKQEKFDVISMMNLLDRCSEPQTMLLNARQALKDNGLIIVALVLPFKPYVEYEVNHLPKEVLPIVGNTFEEQVESFIKYAATVGLQIEQWSRVPYLCEGDFNQSYYWLNDAVFLFKKNPSFFYTNT